MPDRPTDITSSITDQIQPPQASADEARKHGRVPCENPTPQNAIVLFIDHQIGLMAGMRDVSSLALTRGASVDARHANLLSPLMVLTVTSRVDVEAGGAR